MHPRVLARRILRLTLERVQGKDEGNGGIMNHVTTNETRSGKATCSSTCIYHPSDYVVTISFIQLYSLFITSFLFYSSIAAVRLALH